MILGYRIHMLLYKELEHVCEDIAHVKGGNGAVANESQFGYSSMHQAYHSS